MVVSKDLTTGVVTLHVHGARLAMSQQQAAELSGLLSRTLKETKDHGHYAFPRVELARSRCS